MTDNGLAQFFGVTQNEYTILEALYAQILTSDWVHKMPDVGQLNKKADSPICDHLTPYEEKGVWGSIFKELLTTDKELGYGTDDPYGVYLTVEGSRNRYSFLWNAEKYDNNLFVVYQLGAKRTKSAPKLGYVQGGLIRLSDSNASTYGTPLFREALKTYEQILEFHVLPRNDKEDIVPTPAEVLAILQGYGEYPGVDSVIAATDKKEAGKKKYVTQEKERKTANVERKAAKRKARAERKAIKRKARAERRAAKRKAKVKRTSAEWEALALVALFFLPVMWTPIAYLVTNSVTFSLLIGFIACVPAIYKGLLSADEWVESEDDDTDNSDDD